MPLLGCPAIRRVTLRIKLVRDAPRTWDDTHMHSDDVAHSCRPQLRERDAIGEQLSASRLLCTQKLRQADPSAWFGSRFGPPRETNGGSLLWH
jgi:hypothetical protein